ncbi:hypothetical protein [Bacteriophage sp.]|nr:hypothetical protein [Bacteriophage sp.]
MRIVPCDLVLSAYDFLKVSRTESDLTKLLSANLSSSLIYYISNY